MKIAGVFAVLAFGCVVPFSAQAATIVKSYEIVSSFGDPKFGIVTTRFTISYDPTKSNSQVISSYTSDGGKPFANAIAKYSYSAEAQDIYGPIPAVYSLDLGGNGNASAASSNTDDFGINLQLTSTGQVKSVSSYATAVGFNGFAFATQTVAKDLSVVADTAGAVPEPATWMMMLVGFAMVGTVARRRHEIARVTYA